jgi:hypothetical protein
MDAYQIVMISLAGIFLLAGLILVGIFVVFVGFKKLTVRVTANQTWSKRYKNVPVGRHRVKYVDMTKCHYVYKTSKKEYRFKMEFYGKTQRQSPLRVNVTYIKAFPRIFCVNHPQELGAGIYLFFGICFVIMAIALCSIGFSTT